MLFSRTFSVHKNGFAKCPLSPQPPFIMFWKWFYWIYISYQKCPFFCGIHVNYISKFILIGIPKYALPPNMNWLWIFRQSDVNTKINEVLSKLSVLFKTIYCTCISMISQKLFILTQNNSLYFLINRKQQCMQKRLAFEKNLRFFWD